MALHNKVNSLDYARIIKYEVIVVFNIIDDGYTCLALSCRIGDRL